MNKIVLYFYLGGIHTNFADKFSQIQDQVSATNSVRRLSGFVFLRLLPIPIIVRVHGY
jgi:hypothetical protein